MFTECEVEIERQTDTEMDGFDDGWMDGTFPSKILNMESGRIVQEAYSGVHICKKCTQHHATKWLVYCQGGSFKFWLNSEDDQKRSIVVVLSL
ncbi:hypothetical protein PoB_006577100 [Plakobranchus ocellatus]|uniref:Uncharacterized protein n=1 Tax=Plakobranchus ocellatus TaxID=259542 RepID=A0AAV4D524_9GAST|nr:hypothetical protein PoB_006577100 [Plakobranchus ocellatus]